MGRLRATPCLLAFFDGARRSLMKENPAHDADHTKYSSNPKPQLRGMESLA
jgi:hypothetical protein